MPEWTSEQLSAINSFREPVIVSAAAGSGKTAVLVERTIRILSDKSLGVPADSILAVTFTNDAADQMREKLANALEEAGDKTRTATGSRASRRFWVLPAYARLTPSASIW